MSGSWPMATNQRTVRDERALAAVNAEIPIRTVYFTGVSLAFLALSYSCSESIPASTICFLAFVVAILALTKLDVTHPVVWFLSAFTLYSLGASVCVMLDVIPYNENYGRVVFLHQLAAVAFLFGVGPRSHSLRRLEPMATNGTAALFIVLAGLSISLANLTTIFFSAALGKADILLLVGSLGAAAFGPRIVLLGFILHYVGEATREAKTKLELAERRKSLFASMLVFLVFSVLVLMVTGQRKAVFGLLIALIMLRHLYVRWVTPGQLVAALVVFICLVPVLGWNKSLLLRARANDTLYQDRMFRPEILVLTATGEFRASQQNLSILLDYLDEKDEFRWGQGVLEELVVVVIPNFLVQRRQTSSYWFNRTFFSKVLERGEGRGFSMVGFGYLEAGVPGIVILFGSLGCLTGWIYRRASKSGLWLVIYISFAVVVVSALRQSPATILSPMLKHVLLLLAIGFIFEAGLYRYILPVRRARPANG